MNWPHLHLLLNHAPLFGTIFGAALLALALLRRTELTRTALSVLALSGLAALAAYFTGEPAAEALAGAPESLVDRHEDLAGVATVISGVVALAAVVALVASRRLPALSRWLSGTVLALALAATGLLAWTANVGGQIGRRGAGVCPVRGHSNVQGDRTVGIWEKMGPEFSSALGREFGFSPPSRHGLDTVRTIEAMHAGRVKVFVGLGGNFLSATPDTRYTSEALSRCKLTVHVSTKLNRAHLVTGESALILPCLGRTERDVQASGEQFVSVEDTMGVVHASRGSLEPASEHLRSEVAIVAGMAEATLRGRTSVDWVSLAADYDRIRQHIEHVVPGFVQYNARVRQPGGFYLPNAARDGVFQTPSKRARFTQTSIPQRDAVPGRLLLTTLRSHDQFNTTIYGESDRYRGISGGRRVIFLNEDDMRERGLRARQWVDITSHFQGEERRAERFEVVPYPIARGSAAAYYPETNVLVPVRSVARGSNQPASKSLSISLAPSADPPGRRAPDVDEGAPRAAE